MAGFEQAEEDSEGFKEAAWETHYRLLCWREVGEEEGVVDKRGNDRSIKRQVLCCCAESVF